jgi:3-methyladenine DNA glycosylase AlkD
MTLDEALTQLKALANATTRAHNTKYGAGDNQFGVKHGDIRVLAKKIKTDHELAMALWETGNVDAQLLATLVVTPKSLSALEVDRMVRSVTFAHVADWLTPMSSSSTPTRRPFAGSGWPRTTAGRPAPDGASPPSGS